MKEKRAQARITGQASWTTTRITNSDGALEHLKKIDLADRLKVNPYLFPNVSLIRNGKDKFFFNFVAGWYTYMSNVFNCSYKSSNVRCEEALRCTT